MPLALSAMLLEVARSALAILIAALAIYLSLRLLGKIAKFIVSVIIVCLVFYFLFFVLDITQYMSASALWLPSALRFC